MQSPKGFDSVVGEPGSVLNYDESIGEFPEHIPIENINSLAKFRSVQGTII